MVEIRKGEVIRAESPKSGTSSRGDYFMLRMKGEKGSDTITIWNEDGFTCSDGDMVVVTDILSVKRSKRKYNGKWYDETSITAKLDPFDMPSAFSALSGADEELPF